jgi:diacylglycerol kinase (ATP)
MERIAVATSRTRDVATRFILNLTSLDRGAFDGDGGGATEHVCRSMVTGVMLNLTAIADVVPIARYAPSWSIEKYVKVFVTVCACAFGAQWVLVKLVRLRRAQQGWWYYLRHSRHARLILPPECVTEAPMRSPLNRVTRKINKYIKKKGGPLGRMSSGVDAYSPILSVDTESLPEGAQPLLVFVNSRSGGQMGNYLLEELRSNLNPLQVVDLHTTGPKAALKLFANVPNVRVLVAGGDGTVAWILQTIDELDMAKKPPVGILPLGTGNDLARVLGWGGGYSNELISELLVQIQEAHPALLDRWQVDITPNESIATPNKLASAAGHTAPTQSRERKKEIVFQNYLGIGVDAQAALRFHQTRNSRPQLFFSAMTNKLLYGVFGAKDFLEHSCAGLHKNIRIYADGVRQTIPPEAEGIILLNINSFAGGVRMWERDGSYGMSSMQDGMVDIVVVHGALHLGQLNMGVDKPVRICQAREVRVVVDRKLPMHVDGEPWEQSACTIDISLKNKATMLRRTADARGMTIIQMQDTLDWARRADIINDEQCERIMVEAHRRADSVADGNRRLGTHRRSGSIGSLAFKSSSYSQLFGVGGGDGL